MTMTLSEELQWRGFVNQTTYKTNSEIDEGNIIFYWGVDPSSSSMTIGNLASAMMAIHFIRHGHRGIMLVGGATGMVGDPDGKNTERELKSLEEIDQNKKGIIDQYRKIFGEGKFEVVDNIEWFKNINFIDFLRNIGKHVPVRQMLARDFVRKRIGDSGSGISFAEFSYVLIQAYDFYHLNKNKNVTLQLCGSDQWGNSIAGVDLIRRISGNETHVWSTPLVLNKTTGVKFGKSEEGAVWLDEKMTSVYKFYQFWLNVDDEGVEEYLKIYTLLTKEEVDEIIEKFKTNPSGRLAQKTLAYETTKLVHGLGRAKSVQKISEVLFGNGSFVELDEKEKITLARELNVVPAGDDLYEMICSAGLASSKSEARKFHLAGAISVNSIKTVPDQKIDFLKGHNLIKRGKNSFAIVLKS